MSTLPLAPPRAATNHRPATSGASDRQSAPSNAGTTAHTTANSTANTNPSAPTDTRARVYAKGREAASLLLFVTAVFTTLAVASFQGSPTDPHLEGANWVGPVGSSWARLLVGAVGFAAWAVPVELMMLAWPLFKDKASIATIARLAGDFLVIIVLSALVQVALPTTTVCGAMPVAGSVGELFGELMRSLFSNVGSFLIGLTAIGLILIGRSSFSFIAWVQRATHGTEVAASHAASSARAVALAWERAAELRKQRDLDARPASPRIHGPSDDGFVDALASNDESASAPPAVLHVDQRADRVGDLAPAPLAAPPDANGGAARGAPPGTGVPAAAPPIFTEAARGGARRARPARITPDDPTPEAAVAAAVAPAPAPVAAPLPALAAAPLVRAEPTVVAEPPARRPRARARRDEDPSAAVTTTADAEGNAPSPVIHVHQHPTEVAATLPEAHPHEAAPTPLSPVARVVAAEAAEVDRPPRDVRAAPDEAASDASLDDALDPEIDIDIDPAPATAQAPRRGRPRARPRQAAPLATPREAAKREAMHRVALSPVGAPGERADTSDADLAPERSPTPSPEARVEATPAPAPAPEPEPRPVVTASPSPAPAARQQAPAPKVHQHVEPIARAPQRPPAPPTRAFCLPGPALLDPPPASVVREDPEALRARAKELEKVLANYGVKGTVADIHTGPTVSTFEVVPAEGTKVRQVAGLDDDLALGLSCKVRIVAPIPGKSRIGFELPNRDRIPVNLRELVEDRRFQEMTAPLPCVLGRDIVGAPVYADLASMPHVIVAGATGAGKSVGLNVMLISLLMRRTPEQLRLLMVDPKVVELAPFDRIPHLLLPVVTDMKQASNALKWAVDEMERRYQLFANAGTKNIGTYNGWVERVHRGEVRGFGPGKTTTTTTEDGVVVEVGPEREGAPMPDKLPWIVIVVDEFADLIMQQGKDVEASIARLAQKARAAGMHVILATQRPSTDVITGTIKSNFPSRVAFRVVQWQDSKTILDEKGAEQLLGKGDMLVKLNGASDTRRVQGPFVFEEEVQRVTDWLREQGEPVYDESIVRNRDEDDGGAVDDDAELDAKFDEAVRVVAETQKCSTSWLQRKLGLGYNRAAKIVEVMEKRGIVGPSNGAKDREVLIAPL